MSKRKTDISNIKRRVRDLKKDEDVTKVMLDDKYLFATWDYNMEEVTSPIKNLSHIPLWDWFNILNVKTDKLWYLDFTCPFIDEHWGIHPMDMKISTACISFYYDKKQKLSLSMINKRDDDYDEKIEWYKKHNNWKLTFDDFERKNEANKEWNEGVVIFKRDDQNDFNLILPYQYAKSDMSIVDIVREGVNKIVSGKIVPKNKNKKYLKLISEIEYEMFLYDREKSTEMFI